jgi:predicted transposase YbfD/YdcC
VFRLTRERTARGATTVGVAYGLTSLVRSEATAENLLDFGRAHRAIEGGLHSVRDATFGEDECRVRRGQSARVLASLRNGAIHLLRREDDSTLAATTRRLAAFPHRAVATIATPASISA